ncbi:hypothetical protein CCUS01_02890 [Colletotrichum cuscutae]|uniref:Uncharacterized protein n=1 Tax=Colletotrichum cuscutae TaxID=1209917 RepID=A0AAI9YAR5_9PEZI|nr:hypothetical protein CCUS01_02890 [Colletotrichum cuscutae]
MKLSWILTFLVIAAIVIAVGPDGSPHQPDPMQAFPESATRKYKSNLPEQNAYEECYQEANGDGHCGPEYQFQPIYKEQSNACTANHPTDGSNQRNSYVIQNHVNSPISPIDNHNWDEADAKLTELFNELKILSATIQQIATRLENASNATRPFEKHTIFHNHRDQSSNNLGNDGTKAFNKRSMEDNEVPPADATDPILIALIDRLTVAQEKAAVPSTIWTGPTISTLIFGAIGLLINIAGFLKEKIQKSGPYLKWIAKLAGWDNDAMNDKITTLENRLKELEKEAVIVKLQQDINREANRVTELRNTTDKVELRMSNLELEPAIADLRNKLSTI